MRVEIDQSGRVEDLSTNTVVAFSNRSQVAIFIGAGEKRIVVKFLKGSVIFSSDFAPTFFSLLIFLLVQDCKEKSFLIDEEYTGKNSVIEELLVELFKFKRRKAPTIRFGRIGKKSPAHWLAWNIHRKRIRDKTLRKISAREVLDLLDKKRAGSARHTHRVSR